MSPNQFNNEGRLYPNLYYWTASHFVGADINQSLLTIRALNIAIAAILAGLLCLCANANVRGAVFASIVLTWVPLGFFTAASNNGSAWTLIGVSFFWAFLWTALHEVSRRRVTCAWLGAGFSAIIASGSRFDGAIFTFLSASVILAVSWKTCVKFQRKIAGMGVCVLTLITTVYVYMTTEQGEIISVGLMGKEKFEANASDVLWTNILRLPGLFLGIFGIDGFGSGLGWLDTPMPPLTWSLMLVSVVTILAKTSWKRSIAHRFGLAALTVAVVVIPLYVLQVDRAVVIQNVQSRYLLPLVTAIVGISLLQSQPRPKNKVTSRATIWFVGGMVAIAHAAALHTNMRRYISGLDVVSADLNKGREWWPALLPNPNLCWTLATVCMFVVSVYVLGVVGSFSEEIDATQSADLHALRK